MYTNRSDPPNEDCQRYFGSASCPPVRWPPGHSIQTRPGMFA